MAGFAVYYINAMIACILLFVILLINNRSTLDRQEKQIKLDRALIAFIFYFLADIFWAAINDGMLPKTSFTVVLDTLALYIFMVAISYFWLEYVMAVEQIPTRNRPITRFAILFPFMVSIIALIINYLIAPQVLLNDALETQLGFTVYLLGIPLIYLVAILFYTISKARKAESPQEKRKHLFIGFFPLSTVVAGVVQEIFCPYIPIYCFVDALLMLLFYIQSIEAQISIDPLTGLNNRGELRRYASQPANLFIENRLTVVMMLDIDRFKKINDSYGHAEGDRALILVSDVLKKVIGGSSMPTFLGRYGGDEFILILHPFKSEEVHQLIDDIRNGIMRGVAQEGVPYRLSVSAGYAVLQGKDDPLQDCIKRADVMLYQDKARLTEGAH